MFGTIFPYMVIMGNRSIWFGTIFPYMVMAGTGLAPLQNAMDVASLFELALYHSSI